MGGKHKQAQRTKNNARPSSSGRSAELLGSSVNPFIGFSTVKDSSNVSVLPGMSFNSTFSDELVSNIDTNFQLLLKKMNKKDSVTKLKALIEFTELIESSEPEAVKAILPFWPRLYSLLAVDVDHRVRTATHQAHHKVIIKIKRNLAPYLKQLAGPWFTSQYDTYPPAASAAKLSFEAAFPVNKVQEAIAFCQMEILDYVCDNITVQTVQTVCNAKTYSPEEAEAKYERLLVASLQGYTLYLNKLSTEQLQAAEEENLRIISNTKFWKLSKHKVPIIRASLFGCITALCQNASFFLTNEQKNVTATVFCNLDEIEPTVLPATWDAALYIISNITDWWKFVNIEKLVLPKLWKVLKEGGQGNAYAVFPNLLPLISHFPSSLEINAIYKNLFDNMRIGMKKRNVIQSRTEFTAIATSFVECIRYVVMKNVSDIEFCASLITTQLISLIEWCLQEENTVTKILFIESSIILQYWDRNSNTAEVANYKMFIDIFWENIKHIFEKSLSNAEKLFEKGKFSSAANKQIEFLLCLKKNNTVKHKKQVKVKFVSPSRKMEPANVTPVLCLQNGISQLKLDDLVHNTCALYLKYIENNHRYELLHCFCLLIQNFNSFDLFKYINGGSTNLLCLHKNLFLKFLRQENTASQNIVDIIFILYNYLEQDAKEQVLQSFTKLSSDCLRWSVAKALSHPYYMDSTIQNWLSKKTVTDLLIEIASSMLTDEITTDESLLLKQAFQQNTNGELFISKEACTNIMLIFCTALLSPSAYPTTINICASFAAQLSAILYSEKLFSSCEDQLVLALFSLTCNTSYDLEIISKDTLWEINTAWQDVIISLTSEKITKEFENLALKLTKIMHNELLHNFQKDNMNQLIKVAIDLIKAVISSSDSLQNKFYLIMSVLQIPQIIRADALKINQLFLCAEMIKGNISWPFECPLIKLNCVEDVEMFKYFKWYLFILKILILLYQKNETNEDDTDECYILSESTNEIDCLITSLFHFYTAAKSFVKHYNNTMNCYQIDNMYQEYTLELQKFVRDILPTDILDTILNKIDHNKKENVWTKMIYDIHADLLNENDLVKVYVKHTKNNTNDLEYIQLTKIFSNHLGCEVTRKGSNVQLFIATRALIHCEDIDVQLAEALTIFKEMREKNKDLLLYSRDISKEKWDRVQMVVEIIRLFDDVIKYKYLFLTNYQWDFIIISLISWINSVEKSKSCYKNMNVAVFINAVCGLNFSFHKFIQDKELVKSLNLSVVNEYQELFAKDVYVSLFNSWIFIAEQAVQENFCISEIPSLENIGEVILYLDFTYITHFNNSKLPKWQSIIQLCNSLLQSSVSVLQLCGYHCLKQIINVLIEIDVNLLDETMLKTYEYMSLQLQELLNSVQDVVQIMLRDFRLGEDSCRVEPFTDSYRFTFSYILIWDIILSFCQFSSTDVRCQYTEWVRSEEYFKNLLNNIFRLMPTEVLHCTEGKKQNIIVLFTNSPLFKFSELLNSEYLEHMVCWIYAWALSNLPALVRQWWSDSDARISQIVEQVTATYVSRMLCAQEFQDITKKEMNSSNNMKVKIHPTAREVVATYLIDEVKTELIITLPINFPLGSVQIDCNKQIGENKEWRSWVMQLTIFLTHQNGRIWDGLSLWKNNLDKKFDGVEECYICFSVLHYTENQLPKLVCQTCKKKFHSYCLYKWFHTSNKSTCPICRNLF